MNLYPNMHSPWTETCVGKAWGGEGRGLEGVKGGKEKETSGILSTIKTNFKIKVSKKKKVKEQS